MLNLIVILTAITQGLVGLFVYQKRRNSLSNIMFAVLSMLNLAWAIANYIYTLHPAGPAAFGLIRLTMTFVVVQNTAFYVFGKNYPSSSQNIAQKKLFIYLGLSAVVAIAAAMPLVFKSVSIINHQANPNPGPFMPFFLIHALYSIGGGIRSLARKYRAAYGQVRRQLQLILFASALNWILVPITNFVINLAFHTTFFARVSPFYTLAFASIIAYAILAEKLFDIRAAVARSVAYLLIIGTMTLAYGILIFGVLDLIFKGARYDNLRQILSVVLVTPLALSFQSIKSFFDRLTNRLFYRDNYDFRDVLDKTGSLIVAEIELHKILNGTRAVLTDALKSTFIEFVLYKNGRPYFESHTHRTIGQNALALGKEIEKQHKDLVVVDNMSLNSPLYPLLRDAQVALSLRLKTQEQVVGFVIFGHKRSGDVYSSQDEKLLLILANELSIAVQNALRFEEIQNFNLTLQARVDEATRKLRRANEKLKEMDEVKDDFISMASHQLRTPLTSVKGYISMLLDGDAGKLAPTQKDMLNQAFFSSQRMVYLIADLLNVSRLKTGKFVIEPIPVNMAVMVEQELEQLKDMAASRSLTLGYEKPRHFPDLMLDETKTRQVIMNFVDNAIYYTPAGGHVNVRLIDKPTSVELRVEDDGIGVPRSEQPHLFTKFYRAGNARKARPDGTGLGLFMAKKIVIAQHGSIIFESKEGQGSTFGFILNKARLAKPPA